ncbi:hypothetical protein PHYSODRAFT_471648 [Phytophthora sojae]|uniref:Bzip transcription factor n=1 Tax=Phytophthora sojae (strain P6497) TaxID=1094619 RepID=G4YPZ7_PHYSP|nr:hypothetical protein PHYSODRAFT_471648 [Phytophthora sojae]EGZ29312.1 hypothetical protein PHYSODRAFT_471648 [Phytophthora sojae]|eukprot:XP_009516587.1 hypothetical protein PHYSODRAFT_471648 [Phytophthora sojae]
MQSSTLRPPNSHLLSDEVVASLAQNSTRAANDDDNVIIVASRQDPPLPRKQTRGVTQSHPPHATSKDQHYKRQKTPTSFSSKSQQILASGEATIPQFLGLSGHVGRIQHRPNQERYRKKQADLLPTREKDTQQLWAEIHTLRYQRLGLPAGVTTKKGLWDVVADYFRQFRHGLHASANVRTVQLDFVRTTMATDVVFNTEYGIEAMRRSWCFLRWFDDVEVELENLQKSSKMSLNATMTTSVTITNRTLSNVFPYLKKSSSLACKLVGQRIVMRGSARFDWDSSTSRVTSVISQSDMLTPMLRLLGSFEDVSQVFDQALISPEFQWRSMS